MLITRRTFIQSSLLVAAAYTFPVSRVLAAGRIGGWEFEPDKKDTDFLTWEKIADGAFVGIGSGGNSMLIVGKDGGVLSDCKNAPYGPCLRRESEGRAKKLLQVINTHHHADHTGGNHSFSADIEILAQDKCSARVLGQMNRYIAQLKEGVTALGEAPGEPAKKVREENVELYHNITKLKAENWVPKITFAETRDVKFTGINLKLHYFGAGHTDNDIVIHDTDRNILHTGDLLFNKMFPFVDKDSGANTKSWQDSLKKLIAMCNPKTIVVPGHGDVTDMKALQAQIDFFDAAREAVAAAIKAGKTRKDVGELKLDKYADYGLKQIAATSFQTIFDELGGEKK